MTFNCDFDLESAWLDYGFCTFFPDANIQLNFNENPSSGKEDMDRTN